MPAYNGYLRNYVPWIVSTYLKGHTTWQIAEALSYEKLAPWYPIYTVSQSVYYIEPIVRYILYRFNIHPRKTALWFWS